MGEIKLSICMATHNRGAFIGATLESMIAQLSDRVEVVIVDGGSTDNTEQIVERYQRVSSRLRYFRQNTNMGIDRDFAKAVELAQGEYCWLFSDDDFLLPGAIENILGVIKHDFAIVIANSEARDKEMSTVLVPRMLPLTKDRIYKPHEGDSFFSEVATYMTFIGCVIVKRDLWQARERQKYFGSYFIHAAVIFQSPLSADALVVARPLISLRYGNAAWLAKYFQVWMFKWPDLVWSFASYSDSLKQQVCPKGSWHTIKTLLVHRAKGRYSIQEYRELLQGRLKKGWSRVLSYAIAYSPGRILNFLAYVYYKVFGRSSYAALALFDLRDSHCYFRQRPRSRRQVENVFLARPLSQSASTLATSDQKREF